MEVAVLGEFVVGRVISEIQTVATGGTVGINHVAHLSGVAAGVILVMLLRVVMRNMATGQVSVSAE